ncbi:hypothetical protein [Bifidobacterium longum]|uniref:hypothetical protein n=1 Tax=Bifidobacterium longum TaxID=216816 RepID=UPI0026478AB2|nr:hypothetical protein [Bifidobacterium longum]
MSSQTTTTHPPRSPPGGEPLAERQQGNNLHAFADSRKPGTKKHARIVETTAFHRRVEIDVSHAHIFSPEPDIVEKRIEKFGRWACRESPLTAHAAHRQLSESSLIQYTDKNHYVRITICSPVAHQSTAW